MTLQAFRDALVGKRLRWGQREPFPAHFYETIAQIEYDSLPELVWMGFADGRGVFLSRETAEQLVTKGKCKKDQYTYTLRKEKGGE